MRTVTLSRGQASLHWRALADARLRMHTGDALCLVYNRALMSKGEHGATDCPVGTKSVHNGAARQRAARPAAEKEHGELQVLQQLAREVKDPETIKIVSVELMAQAVFNFASCSIVSSAITNSGGMGSLVVPQVMIGHFFLLFALVTATQPISGGHFNPMVSIAMAYWGALQPARLPLYITAQVAGGAFGSILQYQLLPPSLQDAAHAGVQMVPPDHTVLQAFAGEFFAAFILIFLICTVGLDKKGDSSRIPLVVAITVPLLIYMVGPVSSMCINPARAFGPALATASWQNHWLWWTAPSLGAMAAIVPYKWVSELADSPSSNGGL